MRLIIDVGNTRSKWKLFGGRPDRGVFCGAVPTIQELARFVGVNVVAYCSVRGDHVGDDIAAVCVSVLGVAPTAITVSDCWAELRNGYTQPQQLGVDRWVAMVAGWQAVRGAFIVVDVGTAVTADIVAESGHHLGGYIVPGVATMIGALNGDTDRIQVTEEAPANDIPLGQDTVAAVVGGCRLMLCAWIAELVMQHPASRLLVTGGGAPELLAMLPQKAEYHADLVLDGVDLLLSSH